MTVPKRDWRMSKPVGGKSKFDMLKPNNDADRKESKRKGPKRLKTHTLPSQYLKD